MLLRIFFAVAALSLLAQLAVQLVTLLTDQSNLEWGLSVLDEWMFTLRPAAFQWAQPDGDRTQSLWATEASLTTKITVPRWFTVALTSEQGTAEASTGRWVCGSSGITSTDCSNSGKTDHNDFSWFLFSFVSDEFEWCVFNNKLTRLETGQAQAG